MNTPSHLILNLAILRRSQLPVGTWSILSGALIPDLTIFGFYGWTRWAEHLPESVIWRQTYYSEPWQTLFGLSHSIPLALLGLGLSLGLKRRLWSLLFASMVLHQLEDLPLHHDDAHREFLPITNQAFISPISYWDPAHFGAAGAFIELSLVLFAVASLWSRIESRLGKGLLGLVSLLMTAGYGLLYGRNF